MFICSKLAKLYEWPTQYILLKSEPLQVAI